MQQIITTTTDHYSSNNCKTGFTLSHLGVRILDGAVPPIRSFPGTTIVFSPEIKEADFSRHNRSAAATSMEW